MGASRNGEIEDDIVLLLKRYEAIISMLPRPEGQDVIAIYKRADGLLVTPRGNELSSDIEPDDTLFVTASEKDLFRQVRIIRDDLFRALAKENFIEAMTILSELRQPLDTFVDGVMINAGEDKIRLNRMTLLSLVHNTITSVADFSEING